MLSTDNVSELYGTDIWTLLINREAVQIWRILMQPVQSEKKVGFKECQALSDKIEVVTCNLRGGMVKTHSTRISGKNFHHHRKTKEAHLNCMNNFCQGVH